MSNAAVEQFELIADEVGKYVDVVPSKSSVANGYWEMGAAGEG